MHPKILFLPHIIYPRNLDRCWKFTEHRKRFCQLSALVGISPPQDVLKEIRKLSFLTVICLGVYLNTIGCWNLKRKKSICLENLPNCSVHLLAMLWQTCQMLFCTKYTRRSSFLRRTYAMIFF